MGMEAMPVEVVDRKEIVSAMPAIDEIALQDIQMKNAFNTIQHASFDQLEEFVYQEINSLIPLDQMLIMEYKLEPFLYAYGPSLRDMLHTLLFEYTDILQEKDAKEHTTMVQSIFFYVLYYMRSANRLSRGNVHHNMVRELMRTSFELAIAIVTDCNCAIMPFNKEGMDDAAYARKCDVFKQQRPHEYNFLTTVARNKLSLSLLLLRHNVPLAMPLSTMISMVQEFEQFVTPRM